MWRRGGAIRRDWCLQRRPRVSLYKVPSCWSQDISPGRQSCLEQVHREGHTHTAECFKCLVLGDVCATCVSTVDRGHESGHGARGCPASTPKCPLCESLGAPADHRMGGAACTPPPVSQEVVTHPRASCGQEPRKHRQNSGRWSGGGHVVDAIIHASPPK
jgi:hypothetical protein